MATEVFDGDVYTEDAVYNEDKRLFVQFYRKAVQNKFKSEIEGRPIFDEVDMIRILVPGSRDVLENKVNEQYIRRFPKQWDHYKRQTEQTVEGTPLAEVPFLTVSQVAELRGVNVLTLEQLATLPDSTCHKIMGAAQLKQRAENYLLAAKEAAPLIKLQSELEKRDAQIAQLQAQMAQLIEAQKVSTKKG